MLTKKSIVSVPAAVDLAASVAAFELVVQTTGSMPAAYHQSPNQSSIPQNGATLIAELSLRTGHWQLTRLVTPAQEREYQRLA